MSNGLSRCCSRGCAGHSWRCTPASGCSVYSSHSYCPSSTSLLNSVRDVCVSTLIFDEAHHTSHRNVIADSHYTLATSIKSAAYYTTRILPPACAAACSRTSYLDARDGCVNKMLLCWKTSQRPVDLDVDICGEGMSPSTPQQDSLCNRVFYRDFCQPRDPTSLNPYTNSCVPNPAAWVGGDFPSTRF